MGPGILSRPFTTTPLENQELRFRPYFSFSGVNDNGLTRFLPSTGGTSDTGVTNQQAYGMEAGFGIAGRRVYKHDTFEIEFRGNVYRYTPASFNTGGNYLLNLTYQHYFSRHLSIALTASGALYSTNNSLSNSATDLTSASTSLVVSPNTQLFDNRTIYLSTGADVVWQKSARWSFDFGGTGFLVRRESSSLYGTIGSQARIDTSYRLSRRTTVGAYYEYTHYEFDKAFGGSNLQTLGAIYSYSLTKTAQLRVRLGGSRVETTGIETIVLDPVIAAILGYNTGSVTVFRNNYVPDISVQLFQTYRTATGSVEYLGAVSPGNGLILTSRRNTISGHVDYNGIRRWTFSAGASHDTLSTLGVLAGKFTSNDLRAGFNRVLGKGFQSTNYAEFRHYDITGASFLRNSYRISVGIAWTPSERPLTW